ncbi:hypothetical protein WDJ51_09120 [Rathayibacter sp. YIM 133350]|uniref:hypothetical protein n=1 Tax=Rathayibacter sp. YIM 133350 TaxID=3131992 RepID=UPI00307F19AC
MKKKIIAIAIAAAALVGIPAAGALAATYASQGPSVTVKAGEVGTLNFINLDANASVTITGGGADVAVFKAAPSVTKTTDASGAVSVGASSNTPGTFTITATTTNVVSVGTLTVTPADTTVGSGSTGGTGTAGGAGGTGAGSSNSSGYGLSSTGYNAPMLLIWGAGGAVVLGIALVVVLSIVRRNRAHA